MRAVKIAVAIMSVLILVGVTVVVVTLVNRMAGPSGGSVLAAAASFGVRRPLRLTPRRLAPCCLSWLRVGGIRFERMTPGL